MPDEKSGWGSRLFCKSPAGQENPKGVQPRGEIKSCSLADGTCIELLLSILREAGIKCEASCNMVYRTTGRSGIKHEH